MNDVRAKRVALALLSTFVALLLCGSLYFVVRMCVIRIEERARENLLKAQEQNRITLTFHETRVGTGSNIDSGHTEAGAEKGQTDGIDRRLR